jgi:hypothetical protein
MEVVGAHPRVRAWFSGHFHLSQNYADSIVANGGCAFVQTGVIGPTSSRDGDRQSRLLRLTERGYQVRTTYARRACMLQRACAVPGRLQVCTVDHEGGGRVRVDLEVDWRDAGVPEPVTPDAEIVCDVEAGYVCARDACSVLWRDGVRWWPTGAATMLALQDGMLLEYDTATFAPSGAHSLRTVAG